VLKEVFELEMEELIKAITVQVLNLLHKKVLIFITGGAVNIKDIFNALKEFKYLDYSVAMSEAAKEVIPLDYIQGLNPKMLDTKQEITMAVKNSDMIMIPVMTKNTLAKAALGIRDTKVLSGISEAFIQGKKIVTVKDSCTLKPGRCYSSMYINYMITLESFGMEFIDGSEIKEILCRELKTQNKKEPEALENCLSGVITREDLIIHKGIREIAVKKGSVITPFAKDYLDSNGIKLRIIER
jgi:hypothetical protein